MVPPSPSRNGRDGRTWGARNAGRPLLPGTSTAAVLWAWLRALSFQPAWLPARWWTPLAGYIAAGLVQGLTILLTLLLAAMFPSFSFHSTLPLLGVLVVALTFGPGPGLFAVLVGSGLLWFTVLSPPNSWVLSDVGDAIALALWVMVGLAMSVLVGRAEQGRRAAEAATRERDAFLSMASHELRTPLTAVRGQVWRLARFLDRTAQTGPSSASDLVTTVRPMLASIERGTGRMGRLVDELLDVTRLQAGTLALCLAPCDLAAVVREATEEQCQQHTDRAIRLDLPDAPAPVVADADRISQVVTNYLTNALKFSPVDQPVAVTLRVEGAAARVAVQDRGPGLPPEEQAQVWEPFHRAPGIDVLRGSNIGLGLGLAICRTFVELHPGGQVGVESVVGEGSIFWFTLPVAAKPETA